MRGRFASDEQKIGTRAIGFHGTLSNRVSPRLFWNRSVQGILTLFDVSGQTYASEARALYLDGDLRFPAARFRRKIHTRENQRNFSDGSFSGPRVPVPVHAHTRGRDHGFTHACGNFSRVSRSPTRIFLSDCDADGDLSRYAARPRTKGTLV